MEQRGSDLIEGRYTLQWSSLNILSDGFVNSHSSSSQTPESFECIDHVGSPPFVVLYRGGQPGTQSYRDALAEEVR